MKHITFILAAFAAVAVSAAPTKSQVRAEIEATWLAYDSQAVARAAAIDALRVNLLAKFEENEAGLRSLPPAYAAPFRAAQVKLVEDFRKNLEAKLAEGKKADAAYTERKALLENALKSAENDPQPKEARRNWNTLSDRTTQVGQTRVPSWARSYRHLGNDFYEFSSDAGEPHETPSEKAERLRTTVRPEMEFVARLRLAQTYWEHERYVENVLWLHEQRGKLHEATNEWARLRIQRELRAEKIGRDQLAARLAKKRKDFAQAGEKGLIALRDAATREVETNARLPNDFASAVMKFRDTTEIDELAKEWARNAEKATDFPEADDSYAAEEKRYPLKVSAPAGCKHLQATLATDGSVTISVQVNKKWEGFVRATGVTGLACSGEDWVVLADTLDSSVGDKPASYKKSGMVMKGAELVATIEPEANAAFIRARFDKTRVLIWTLLSSSTTTWELDMKKGSRKQVEAVALPVAKEFFE